MVTVSLGSPAAKSAYVTPKALYLDKAGRVVDASDETRVELLAPKGAAIPRARALALGLISPGGDEAPAPVTPIVSDPTPLVSDPSPQTSDPDPTAPVPARRTK